MEEKEEEEEGVETVGEVAMETASPQSLVVYLCNCSNDQLVTLGERREKEGVLLSAVCLSISQCAPSLLPPSLSLSLSLSISLSLSCCWCIDHIEEKLKSLEQSVSFEQVSTHTCTRN